MAFIRVSSWLLAATVVCCLCGGVWGSVIAIDFGSELIKVALVKPGVPMEIVLNSESKRKTPAVVSLRNNERLFGDAALNTAVKYPKSAYWYLQLLLGQKFDSPLAQEYMERFPYYDYVKDEDRGTVLFQHDKNTVYSPEELVAMMLNNSRQYAESYAGQTIRDVVITVPSFFNQAQRRAMLYCAELVGLNVLQLMSDSAAAALNYGVFRQASFNLTPTYFMLFDMGASSTVATIIEYRKVQVKEKGVANTHPQLAVKGAGFDRTLGGLEMDLRLRKHLADKFDSLKRATGSVYDSPRAMAKLLKEAKRVKQVLSANTEHYAQVEGLLEDIDFRAKVTRDEFEELCSDLLQRIEGLVEQALQAADITLEEVESVILVGGGTRVPAVQDALLDSTDRVELGHSLNTDDAFAMGAVYQGAGHSKLFRVQKFIVKESAAFPIQVSFTRPVSGEGGEGGEGVMKTVTRTLFQRSNPYPQKKLLTFNRYTSDFSFQVFYGNLGYLSEPEQSYLGRLNLTEVYLAGVENALASHSTAEPRGVKAHFNMDASGLLQLELVQSLFEYPSDQPFEEQSTLSKLGSTLSSFFGVGGDMPPEPTNEDAAFEELPLDQNENESTGMNSEQQSDSDGMESEQQSESDGTESDSDDGMEPEPSKDVDDEDIEASVDSGMESSPEDSEEESEPENGTAKMKPESEPEQEDEDSGMEPNQESDDNEQLDATENEDTGMESDQGNGTNSTSDDNMERNATNTTTKKSKKEKSTENTVKVNITAEITILDLAPPTSANTVISTNKLVSLQLLDDDKRDNEQAKNNLESHVFQTLDAMYADPVVAVTTEEQREEILVALTEASDWLDDEGYMAETKVYRDKLRILRRSSRAVFRRVEEAEKRPVLAERLHSSINMSHDFLFRMRNLTGELQIFTEVEMDTLEALINETEAWLNVAEVQQSATPPHEEPVLLTYEMDEHMRRLDREIMYLLNKLRSHPPPTLRPKNSTSKANDTKVPEESETTPTPNESNETTPTSDEAEPPLEETTPTSDESEEAAPTYDETTPTPDESAEPPSEETTPTVPLTEEVNTESEIPEFPEEPFSQTGDDHQEL